MPSKSKAQRRLMAIAEHHPEELYSRNKGVAKMTKKQLHEYASTSEANLPKHVKKKKKSSKKSRRRPSTRTRRARSS